MTVTILVGDVRERLAQLPDNSVQCVVTSPPYFALRSYLPSEHPDKHHEIGAEPTLAEYIAAMVEVFRGVRRVLRDDGCVWLNCGDSFENKQLLMVPARLAIALQDDGWWLRSDIIWHKPNPMPESVRDRPSTAHEHIFLLTKSDRYFYDADAVRTELQPDPRGAGLHNGYSPPGQQAHRGGQSDGIKHRTDKQRGHGRRHDGFNDRWDAMSKDEQQANGANLRNVWTIATHPFPGAHFATFPPEIPRRCIKAGTSQYGACSACGAPWRRVVEKEKFDRPAVKLYGGTLGHNPTGTVPGSNTRGMPDPMPVTTGWEPTCACNADVMPCTVLDPFGGAGTTGLVADELGRGAILIELNPEYARLAHDRIVGASPMFADVVVEAA